MQGRENVGDNLRKKFLSCSIVDGLYLKIFFNFRCTFLFFSLVSLKGIKLCFDHFYTFSHGWNFFQSLTLRMIISFW